MFFLPEYCKNIVNMHNELIKTFETSKHPIVQLVILFLWQSKLCFSTAAKCDNVTLIPETWSRKHTSASSSMTYTHHTVHLHTHTIHKINTQ